MVKKLVTLIFNIRMCMNDNIVLFNNRGLVSWCFSCCLFQLEAGFWQ